MRQVGTRIHPGANVGVGRDWTLFALIEGTVKYERWGKRRTRARIEPAPAVAPVHVNAASRERSEPQDAQSW